LYSRLVLRRVADELAVLEAALARHPAQRDEVLRLWRVIDGVFDRMLFPGQITSASEEDRHGDRD
jgi:hypothetical protein